MDRQEPIEKRFIFHGNAVALAAHIRRPADFQCHSVASSCLPVTGGVAEASSGPLSYLDETISFRSASSSARGDFADSRRAIDFTHGNHGDNELSTQTFVDSKLSGFKISITQDNPPAAAGKRRVFAVEELHARLESASDRRNPTAFRGLEANFEGVTVDGHELLVTRAPEVCTHYETYDKLLKAYEEDGDFRKQFGDLFYPAGDEKTGLGALLHKHSIPNAGGLILGTVVSGMRWAKEPAPGTAISGNRLQVEGVGYFYFGEILYEQEARRLTLLRFQLGSPRGGSGAACDVHSNGQGYPPPK